MLEPLSVCLSVPPAKLGLGRGGSSVEPSEDLAWLCLKRISEALVDGLAKGNCRRGGRRLCKVGGGSEAAGWNKDLSDADETAWSLIVRAHVYDEMEWSMCGSVILVEAGCKVD